MQVTNVNGSGRFSVPRGYTSWLEYWEEHAGEKARYCENTTCYTNSNLVGAHVQKACNSDKSWYIIPLCRACNNKSSSEVFDVSDKLVPVPSNL